MSHSLPALLLLLSISCSASEESGTSTPDGAAASAERANARSAAGASLGGPQRGEFVDGDERSSWMLTVTRDGGVSIEDEGRFGADGQANRVFTYNAAGTLLRATEQRTQTAQGAGDQSPATVRTELIVDFTGTTPVATKMVDDVRRTVESYETDNIRRRGDALLQQARRTSPR